MEILNTVFAGVSALAAIAAVLVALNQTRPSGRTRPEGSAPGSTSPVLFSSGPSPAITEVHVEPSRSPLPEHATPPVSATGADWSAVPAGTFFDPSAPDAPVAISLELLTDEIRGGSYLVTRQLGYKDAAYSEPFLFPSGTSRFLTDLQSVPMIFSWLLPRQPTAGPALLLHDAMVTSPGEPPAYLGPRTSQREVDRIFRDSLRAVGVGPAYRWLIWMTAALGTLVRTSTRRAWLFAAWFVAVTIIDVLALFDALDRTVVGLPWTGEGPFLVEAATVPVVAVAVPLVTSVLFGKDRAVIALFGSTYGLLLVPIILNAAAVASFWVIDRFLESVGAGAEGPRRSQR